MPGGDRTRKKRLQQDIEEIIATTLGEQWLMLEAPPLAPVVAEIRARCEEAGLAPPSYLTIARRIPALFGPEEIAKKRSANPKHLHRLRARPGYIHAAHPLDVCQIDHTPTDINFVEVVEGGGTFVGRAYLTIVTDVATRCILGFCLTPEKPSALSVALCLAQAMCPKEDWLTERGIKHGWPMFGRPLSLVTDSAKSRAMPSSAGARTTASSASLPRSRPGPSGWRGRKAAWEAQRGSCNAARLNGSIRG